MNFEKALEALNENKVLSRKPGEYIFQRKQEILKKDLLIYNQQLPYVAKLLLIKEDSDLVVLPSYCKYERGSQAGPGGPLGKVHLQWSMSAADMAATDWEVLQVDASILTAPERKDLELASKVEKVIARAVEEKKVEAAEVKEVVEISK